MNKWDDKLTTLCEQEREPQLFALSTLTLFALTHACFRAFSLGCIFDA